MFCTRLEATWTHFEDDVDYVVPLTVRKIEVKDSDELQLILSNLDFPSIHRRSSGRCRSMMSTSEWSLSGWNPRNCLRNWTYLSAALLFVTIGWCETRLFFEIMLCFTGGRITVLCVICWLSLTLCGKKYYTWTMTCVTLAIRGRSILSTVYSMLFIGLGCTAIFIHMSRYVPSATPTKSPDVAVELD